MTGRGRGGFRGRRICQVQACERTCGGEAEPAPTLKSTPSSGSACAMPAWTLDVKSALVGAACASGGAAVCYLLLRNSDRPSPRAGAPAGPHAALQPLQPSDGAIGRNSSQSSSVENINTVEGEFAEGDAASDSPGMGWRGLARVVNTAQKFSPRAQEQQPHPEARQPLLNGSRRFLAVPWRLLEFGKGLEVQGNHAGLQSLAPVRGARSFKQGALW